MTQSSQIGNELDIKLRMFDVRADKYKLCS